MENREIEQIEKIIGYHFADTELLEKAFTHSSAVDNRKLSNERLEFLGDSILGLVICQALFERFTNYLEGDLTKIKSMVVSRQTCATVLKQLDLLRYLKLGKGMVDSRALAGSLAAGLFEGIIGAVYVDGGFEAAQTFILKTFENILSQANSKQAHGNYKSILQQYAQQQLNVTPVYDFIDEKGPDHNKCFEVEAVIAGERFQSAWGVNKKQAEQKAAYNALQKLGLLDKNTSEEPED